jgi:hypothetical protein
MDGTVHYAYNAKTGQYDIPVEYMLTEEEKAESDQVNHPSHYTAGKIEVIEFLEDQNLPFHLANALKYICRAGKKNPDKTVEDLEKAVWYINRYINHVLRRPAGEDDA